MQCRLAVAADHLGDRRGAIVGIAGIFALGRIGEVKIVAGAQPAGFQYGFQNLRRRSGPCSRFKNDQLAGPQMGRNRLTGGYNEFQIGFAKTGQRRGHADQNGVHIDGIRKIRGRTEFPRIDDSRDPGIRDMPYVGFTLIQESDLGLVDIEPGDGKSFSRKGLGQWQSDITQPDNANSRAAIQEVLFQSVFAVFHGIRHSSHQFAAPRFAGYRTSRKDCQRVRRPTGTKIAFLQLTSMYCQRCCQRRY